MAFTIHNCDVLEGLRAMEPESVQCVVTSPPYWGLRDYQLPPQVWGGDRTHEHDWEAHVQPAANGMKFSAMKGRALNCMSATRKPRQSAFCSCGAWRGQLGLEPTLDLYLTNIVSILEEVGRVLRRDGTLWLNMGDCYSNSGGVGAGGNHGRMNRAYQQRNHRSGEVAGLGSKQLIGLPWRVVFALQDAGWVLRRDIIWHKLNAMPEAARDRPACSHEYLFLLSRSRRYHYDREAIKEPVSGTAHARGNGVNAKITSPPAGWQKGKGAHSTLEHNRGDRKARPRQNQSFSGAVNQLVEYRNKRTVWPLVSEPTRGTHFAAFPQKLVEPCILAGSRVGDLVLDPFSGIGTTGKVALRLGRRYVGIELNDEWAAESRAALAAVVAQGDFLREVPA